MAHDQGWPIYSLANYDNFGLLIEQCNSLLALDDAEIPSRFNKETLQQNKKQYGARTTSDHHKGRESWSHLRQRRRRHQGAENNGRTENSWPQSRATCKLAWWSLIELVEANEDDADDPELAQDNKALDRLYQARVLELCYRIKLALSPFVSNEPGPSNDSATDTSGMNDGATIPANRRQFGELNVLGHPLTSAHPMTATGHSNGAQANGQALHIQQEFAVHSSARLRRLSWRKRHQIYNNSNRNNDAGSNGGTKSEPVAWQSIDGKAGAGAGNAARWRTATGLSADGTSRAVSSNRRQLMHNSGQTFSLDDALEPGASPRQASRMERWLSELDSYTEHKQQGTLSAGVPDAPPGGRQFANKSTARGSYGESIVHILLVNHSNEHLIVFLLVLHLWPHLLFDVFQSDKFRNLNCLHLTIASENSLLLGHLIGLAQRFDSAGGAVRRERQSAARRLVEQRVSGTLFKSPLDRHRHRHWQSVATSGSQLVGGNRTPIQAALSRSSSLSSTGSRRADNGDAARYWCDQIDHWPTANGAQHLILLDRFKSRLAGERLASNSFAPDRPADQEDDLNAPVVYLGETPLSWSVCFKSRPMFELLVDRAGASVNSTDSCGNNCLHQLVINNRANWIRFLIKHSVSLTARNSMNLTPFLLACHLGHCEVFNEFIELTAVDFWTYSSVRCCGYPLGDLDSLITETSDCGGGGDGNELAVGSRGRAPPPPPAALRSAVSVILESNHSSDQQKAALLSTNVMNKLLEEKWKTFARRLFYRDLFILLAQLLLMILAGSLRPARIKVNYAKQMMATARGHSPPSDWLSADQQRTLFRHICELFIVCIAINRLWMVVVEWFRYRSFRSQMTYNPFLANLVVANSFIVACVFIRLAGLVIRSAPVYIWLWWWRPLPGGLMSHAIGASALRHLDQLEDVLLIIASPLLWSSLLFFVAAFYATGPFVAMINYMLTRDLKQFSLIYLIFMCSFAQCIFFINYNQQPQSPAGASTRGASQSLFNDEQQRQQQPQEAGGNATAVWSSAQSPGEFEIFVDWLGLQANRYFSLCLELFKMTLCVYELQPYRHSIISRFFLMLFLYLIPVLFNMLIAMMNNTYSLIISQSERAWSFQWAKTLLALERRLNDEQKKFYLKKYSINLSSSIKQKKSDYAGKDDENNGDMGKLGENDNVSGTIANEEQFVPGLMIIRRTNCTRAETRRRLIGYWQKSLKQVISERKRESGRRQEKRCSIHLPST